MFGNHILLTNVCAYYCTKNQIFGEINFVLFHILMEKQKILSKS